MIFLQEQQLIKTIIINEYPNQSSFLKPWNIQNKLLTIKQKKVNSQTFKNQKNHYNHLVVKKLLDLINKTNNNSHFLSILAFNAQIIHDYISIQRILMPFSILSLKELVGILKVKSYQISISLIQLFVIQIQHLWEIYKDELLCFNEQCYDFSLIKSQDSYRIVIQFNQLEFTQQPETNHYPYPFHLNQMLSYLKQYTQNKSSLLSNLSISQNYHALSQPIHSKLKHYKQLKQDYLIYNYSIINAVYSHFLHNLYNFIDSTIQGLTFIIYSNKKHHDRHYSNQIIHMIDPLTNSFYKGGAIYHNLGCQHFQGISYQIFSTMQNCPICSKKLFFDQQYIEIYCHNILQSMLSLNYFNKNDNRYILYNFDYKSFIPSNDIDLLKNKSYYKNSFKDYHSFKVYIERYHKTDVKVASNHQYENISLYNKLNGKKVFVKGYELIDCPVRGKYCRHWQCFDLIKVYTQILSNPNKEFFQCFICCKDIKYQQIIYLQQIKMMIDFIKYNFYDHYEQKLELKLLLNHKQQNISIFVRLQQEAQYRLQLNVYETFRDNRRKSRYIADIYEQNNLIISEEFRYFFYGI